MSSPLNHEESKSVVPPPNVTPSKETRSALKVGPFEGGLAIEPDSVEGVASMTEPVIEACDDLKCVGKSLSAS
jgi:hypothetical protein